MFENTKKKNEDLAWQNRVDAYVEDLKKIDEKHQMTLKPIITQDGPKLVPVDLSKIFEAKKEKPYVKTSESSSSSEATPIPKE